MDEFELIDGNGLFNFVSTSEISPKTQESYEVIKSFVRSAIHTGGMDLDMDPDELEKCLSLLNLLNAIRWFQETYKEVEPWDM